MELTVVEMPCRTRHTRDKSLQKSGFISEPTACVRPKRTTSEPPHPEHLDTVGAPSGIGKGPTGGKLGNGVLLIIVLVDAAEVAGFRGFFAACDPSPDIALLPAPVAFRFAGTTGAGGGGFKGLMVGLSAVN